MQTLRQQNIEIEAQALAAVIANEQAAGVEHFNSTAAVSDPFITPFFRAVKREGYSQVLKGSCMELKPCERCRKHSAGVYTRDGNTVLLCPLCDRKKEGSHGPL